MRMKVDQHAIGVTLAVIVLCLLLPNSLIAGGTLQYYPAYLPKDAVFAGGTLTSGTPFAVRGEVAGAPANTSCYGPKLRLMSGTDADNNFKSWASGTNQWVGDTGAWASFGSITTDASGNWSGWGYGAMTSSASYTSLVMRIRCGSNNYDTATVSVSLLDMSSSGTGGWLEETGSSSRAGRAIAVKSGATLIGLYVIEDNSINEGYAYSAGGYKVAVPACTTCGYTIETWNLASPGTAVGSVNTMGMGGCPNTVTAGSTTSLNGCSVPTLVTLSFFTASTGNSSPAPTLLVVGIVIVSSGLTVGICLRLIRRTRSKQNG